MPARAAEMDLVLHLDPPKQTIQLYCLKHSCHPFSCVVLCESRTFLSRRRHAMEPFEGAHFEMQNLKEEKNAGIPHPQRLGQN